MKISVATWNCFGMAQGAVDAILGQRAKAAPRLRDPHVAATLSASDVLCVQELFSRDAQDLFDSVLSASRRAGVRDHNRFHLGSGTMRGTGLGVGAKGGLAGQKLEHFASRGVGWDRLARKGMLYARVAFDEELELDVVTTHLQSGYDAGAKAVRQRQLEQLGKLVAEVGSPERTMVVCGDFNINGLRAARGDAEYKLLRATLEGFEDLGEGDDRPTFHPHPEVNRLAHESEPGGPEQRIDYIFLRPASRAPRQVRCEGVSLVLESPLPSGGAEPSHASDHFGLMATFERGA